MAGFLTEDLGSLVFLPTTQYYRSHAGSDDEAIRVVNNYFSGFEVECEPLFPSGLSAVF
jgi:hypothetical protein